MADATKVKIGVCSVTFNSVDIGHTIGGCEVTYEPKFHEINVDKYGDTVVERVLIGEKLSVKVPMAEYTMANLKAAMPAATLAGTTAQKLSVGSSAGKKMSLSAATLVLHPLANSGTDYSGDVTLGLAHAASNVVLKEQYNNEKVIEVTFEALIDETKTDGAYLGYFGAAVSA